MKLYLTCDRCPLDVFLDCLFEKELERLIISGGPDIMQLENAWQNLYAEYCGLTNQGNLSDHMQLMRDCNIAISYIQLVESITKVLQAAYDPELIGILEQLGLKPSINPDDSFHVIAEKLEKVLVRAKKFIVEYKTKKLQLDQIEKQNMNRQSSRSVYEDTLTALSRFYGYPVKANDISVGRFVRESDKLNQEMQRRIAMQKTK